MLYIANAHDRPAPRMLTRVDGERLRYIHPRFRGQLLQGSVGALPRRITDVY